MESIITYSFVLYLQHGRHDVKCKPSIYDLASFPCLLVCYFHLPPPPPLPVHTLPLRNSTGRKSLPFKTVHMIFLLLTISGMISRLFMGQRVNATPKRT